MIFRPTHRLCAKIKVGNLFDAPLHDNPYVDWSARLFTVNRLQYMMLTNTASLYSVLMPGRGITEETPFLDRALESMRNYMQSDGLSLIFANFIVPATQNISFHKPLSRSITGSMNELEAEAKLYLKNDDYSPFDTTELLNDMPLSANKYCMAREAFKRLGG